MISKELLDYIRGEYNAGRTQCEIASRHHTTQTCIQSLLSGKRSPRGLTLATVEKMFPLASLNLTGSGASQVLQINGDGNHHVTQQGREELRQRLVEKVVALDIPDDARTKVLRLILSL